VFEPFNGDNTCRSSAKKAGYAIPVDGAGVNMLTNKKNGDFTIDELEVWAVTFLVINYISLFLYRINDKEIRH
jgi:hypothetical protein